LKKLSSYNIIIYETKKFVNMFSKKIKRLARNGQAALFLISLAN